MPNDNLISSPVLDPRTEPDFIGEGLWFLTQGTTVEECDRNIAIWEAAKRIAQQRGPNPNPTCSELSSARAPESHVVMFTNMLRPHVETRFRMNQITLKTHVELLRILGESLREATPATCLLEFTKLADFLSSEVTVPAGTFITTVDGKVTVATDEDMVIAAGTLSATVGATATEAGDFGPAEAGTIGQVQQSIAGIETGINTTKLNGGSDAETVEQAIARAREEMRIGEHLGSALDYVDHIYYEVLRRIGRVTVFERMTGNFIPDSLGNLLIVIQGSDGLAPTQALLNEVSAAITPRRIAGIYVAVRAPLFKPFDIRATVKIAAGQSASTLIARAEANLRADFDPLTFRYGQAYPERFISGSDVVGAIERASKQLIDVVRSPDLQVTFTVGGQEIKSDIALGIGELPNLGTVTLTTL